MQDFLADRLSKDELSAYERYDALAMVAAQLFVWPGLLALICAITQQTSIAWTCGIISAIALPCMLVIGRQARKILKLAEARYLAVMDPTHFQPM